MIGSFRKKSSIVVLGEGTNVEKSKIGEMNKIKFDGRRSTRN
jgi:hypothetical protein